MDGLFKILEREASVNSNKIPEETIRKIIEIIKRIR